MAAAAAKLDQMVKDNQICPDRATKSAKTDGASIFISAQVLCNPATTLEQVAMLLIHERGHMDSSFNKKRRSLCDAFFKAKRDNPNPPDGSKKKKQLRILERLYENAIAADEAGADGTEHEGGGALGAGAALLDENKAEICDMVDFGDDPTTTDDPGTPADEGTPDGPGVDSLCDSIDDYEADNGTGDGITGFSLSDAKASKDTVLAEFRCQRKRKNRLFP